MRTFITFILLLAFTVENTYAQDSTVFSILPNDTVGLLMYKGKVFNGTKMDLLKIHQDGKYFTEQQPFNENAVVIVTWNKLVS